MPSAASCRRLSTLVAQVAPAPSADRSFAGSELDPVSGANAGMTITDIKPCVYNFIAALTMLVLFVLL